MQTGANVKVKRFARFERAAAEAEVGKAFRQGYPAAVFKVEVVELQRFQTLIFCKINLGNLVRQLVFGVDYQMSDVGGKTDVGRIRKFLQCKTDHASLREFGNVRYIAGVFGHHAGLFHICQVVCGNIAFAHSDFA